MKIDGKNIWPFISGIIIFSAINFYFCFSIGPKIFAAVINFLRSAAAGRKRCSIYFYLLAAAFICLFIRGRLFVFLFASYFRPQLFPPLLLLPALHFIRLAVSPFHFGSLPKIGCREK